MKRKIVFFLATLTVAAVTLGGCNFTSASREKEMDYREQGIELMDAGKYTEALQMFETALGQSYGVISDLDIDICFYKAAAQYNAGDVAGAIETYDNLIDYDDKDANAYYLRGTVYLKQSDAESAAADYAKAVELNGSDYELYEQIYANYKAAGDEATGQTYLQTALQLKGTDMVSNREKGYINYLLGDTDQAISLLQSSVAEKDEKSYLYLTEIYISQENYTDALDMVTQGMSIEDGAYAQQFAFAEVTLYEYMGDFSTAKEKMAAYLESYPNDENATRENTFLSTR